ncbi:uncharacterized protein Z519_09400 [Cladophialophora bantiana CBS 173.52]|uniref:DNA polymerase epsilon subunit D n=1 Tax=Cladophialophora bantiana (strain ATCC 10958 / CBS 173.52 / CDC B-1940 / NIH 8579) TaxID=1442370 RepID=A0A0D2HGT3_CLAB1|nr:uncharacterized protein Z519_09400 [Cladophialophora bantiana CBS 173.52]KIW89970.1 hypothetical protein Z519_09400 [Cladophialophora bantiana CBS 173.52]
MPPRKSGASIASAPEANGDVSILSNATNATASSSIQHAHAKSSRQSGGRQDDGVGIDDLLLPRSLISRLSRGVLPANTSLQKDAILALTRSATVFISYLAHHANEQSQLRHKKTLAVQDVMAALREIEFGHVMDLGVVGKDGRTGGRLEREVEAYEEIIGRKRRGYKEKLKARESGGAEGDDGEVEEDKGEPSNKKIRRMSAEEEDEEERMLEQQLNGTTTSEPPVPRPEKAKGKRKSKEQGGISVVVRNGKGKTKPYDATQKEEEVQLVDEDREADLEEGDTGAEDDDEQDEEEVEDDEEDDDDDGEDDEDEEQDDEDDEAAHHDADDDDDIYDSRLVNGRSGGRVGLLPDGNVEIGTDDESD